MRNVLADLALDSEAATASVMRVARAYDAAHEADFRRFATAVMKYSLTKRAPPHAAEALECLGGNGDRRGFGDADALSRRADQLGLGGVGQRRRARRPARRGPRSPRRSRRSSRSATSPPAPTPGSTPTARGWPTVSPTSSVGRRMTPPTASAGLYESQFEVRRLVEDLALAFQGSLLVRHAPPAVADAFCASRFSGDPGRAYGTLPAGVDAAAIIDRALPA